MRRSNMEDLNKITSTRVGDNIHFFVNGAEDSGTVVKMNTSFVTVVKDDGNLQDIHINDTFFIKDIIVNKTWNDMTMEERTVALHEIHAYSPRFLAKSWQELPTELKDVMLEKTLSQHASPIKENKEINPSNKPMSEKRRDETNQTNSILSTNNFQEESTRARGGDLISGRTRRAHGDNPSVIPAKGEHLFTSVETGKSPKDLGKSNVEQGHYGSAGRASHAPETNMDIDATEDYEGQTEDEKKEQFKHEEKKPQTTDKSMQEQIWEEWVNKFDRKEFFDSSSGGDGDTGSKTSTGVEPTQVRTFGHGSKVTHKDPSANKPYDQKTMDGNKIIQEATTAGQGKPELTPSKQFKLADSTGGMSGGSAPAATGMQTTGDTFNAVYGKDGRIKGQGKDKEEDEEKERKG